jgi:hypothetical protein
MAGALHTYQKETPPPPEQTNNRNPRVLLLGDSLTKQVFLSCSIANGQKYAEERLCHWNGIDYSHEWLRALLLDSILYQSQDAAAQACARTKVAGHFRRRDMIYYTEQAVKDLVQGYDFVFFNQFAWWHIVADYLRPCYDDLEIRSSNATTSATTTTTTPTTDLATTELVAFFAAQVNRFAELVASLNDSNNNTKATAFYYRTASPHAFPWVKNGTNPVPMLLRMMTPLTRVPAPFATVDCIGPDRGGHFHHQCADPMNDIAIAAFRRHGHAVLDSAPVLNLRVDAHPCSFVVDATLSNNNNDNSDDCLHFCIPGPAFVVLEAIEAEVYARLRTR